MQSPASLNELGDALAGIFAPIAFFWLIMGYVQQGKQLDQNTKALEQQERALQLQIEEIQKGIEQQVQLVQTQKTAAFGTAATAISQNFYFRFSSKSCFW